MIPQSFHFVACAMLLLCFVAFSIASFRHFDPASQSAGNLVIRALTLGGTALNAGLTWLAGPPEIGLSVASIACGVVSLCVFWAALRSVPKGSLHVAFTGSGPDQLVTAGLYRHIRNPLYTSYLLFWAGWVPVSGLHPVSVACFALFLVVYWMAVVEEERFLTHRFGEQYVAFKSRTGRFLPLVRALRG